MDFMARGYEVRIENLMENIVNEGMKVCVNIFELLAHGAGLHAPAPSGTLIFNA